jgi:hypothetical protein
MMGNNSSLPIGNGDDTNSFLRYTTVKGFFLQDELNTDTPNFDPVSLLLGPDLSASS